MGTCSIRAGSKRLLQSLKRSRQKCRGCIYVEKGNNATCGGWRHHSTRRRASDVRWFFVLRSILLVLIIFCLTYSTGNKLRILRYQLWLFLSTLDKSRWNLSLHDLFTHACSVSLESWISRNQGQFFDDWATFEQDEIVKFSHFFNCSELRMDEF